MIKLFISPSGSHNWTKDTHLHRLSGPAVVDTDGYQGWYINGQRHRLDGPAIVYASGTAVWFRHGVIHRTNGPAYISVHGEPPEYWVNDRQVTEYEAMFLTEDALV